MVDVQERADEGVTKGRVASRKRAQETPGESRGSVIFRNVPSDNAVL